MDTVAYAKDRGVRVMLELDTPGHTAAFRYGYPDVVAAWFGWCYGNVSGVLTSLIYVCFFFLFFQPRAIGGVWPRELGV